MRRRPDLRVGELHGPVLVRRRQPHPLRPPPQDWRGDGEMEGWRDGGTEWRGCDGEALRGALRSISLGSLGSGPRSGAGGRSEFCAEVGALQPRMQAREARCHQRRFLGGGACGEGPRSVQSIGGGPLWWGAGRRGARKRRAGGGLRYILGIRAISKRRW